MVSKRLTKSLMPVGLLISTNKTLMHGSWEKVGLWVTTCLIWHLIEQQTFMNKRRTKTGLGLCKELRPWETLEQIKVYWTIIFKCYLSETLCCGQHCCYLYNWICTISVVNLVTFDHVGRHSKQSQACILHTLWKPKRCCYLTTVFFLRGKLFLKQFCFFVSDTASGMLICN